MVMREGKSVCVGGWQEIRDVETRNLYITNHLTIVEIFSCIPSIHFLKLG